MICTLAALALIFYSPMPGQPGGCPWLSTSELCGPLHPGVDYIAPYGTPVHAAAAGLVVFAGLGRWEWGRIVLIEHFTGDGPMWTQYAHLSRLDVHAGDSVYPGQVIGAVGDAGGLFAPHLHYEIRTCQRAADAWTQGMTRKQVEACYVEPTS